MNLKEKVLFITGASRGIGKAIALKAARDGAFIVIASKTVAAHPKLPGTIGETAKEVEALGGKALPLELDVRDSDAIYKAVESAVKTFGKIDILVNNASAISLEGTESLTYKQYNLMHEINVRGTFFCSQSCLPYLKKSSNPHILNMSPPLNLKEKFLNKFSGYAVSKFGMSMCVLGMAHEFARDGIAVNALWPKTIISTSALGAIVKDPNELAAVQNKSRKPSIMADAAYYILTQNSRAYTGQFLVDEDVLRQAGVKDFDQYAVLPGQDLLPDFFLD